jgi:hypothetical protein
MCHSEVTPCEVRSSVIAVLQKMRQFKDQLACIKFCFKQDTIATETSDRLKPASEEETVSRTKNIQVDFRVQKWNDFC